MHLGRGDGRTERDVEADLIACLRSQEDEAEGLFLLGDVFDAYIEYRRLVPKGFVRFQALLASWTDRGIPITYLVGNHDPWHRDYFEKELGVRVVFDHLERHRHGRQIYLSHGDGIARQKRLYRLLKPVLRHPVPVWLYRALLPGDVGIGLAHWFNDHFATDNKIDAAVVDALREHARHRLQHSETDLVVMGHSHRGELLALPEGTYLNPGWWRQERTFGQLDDQGPALMRWNGTCTLDVSR